MRTKTFYQIRNEVEVYPQDFDDDALKATIADWFDRRHVCDDNYFVTYFRRVLNEDYARYKQLMRIEAGIAQYDWLVQEYHEHKVDTLRTPNLTQGIQDGGSITHTITPAETTETHSGNDTNTKTGSVTDTGDYSDTLTEKVSDLDPYKETTTTTHPKRTIHTGVAENAVHEGTNGSDNVHLVRNNPMSSSYVSGVTSYAVANGGAGSTAHMSPTTTATSSLDWKNPSSQEETNNLNAEKSTDTRDASDNYTEEETTYTGTDKVEREYSGERIRERVIDGDVDKKVYNTIDTLTHGHKIEKTTDTAGSDVETRSLTGARTTTGTDNTVVKDRYTGRHDAPAEILTKATQFIKNTEAWKWLYQQLDTCFISILEL